MGFIAMAMLAFAVTTCFISGEEAPPCPPDTIEISITSAADLANLTDSLACVGQGDFNIMWHSNVAINERIEVSDGKNVTVTADALGDDNAGDVLIDAGNSTGIFSVSDGSTLRLNNIALEGGNAEDGGAVAVLSSSALFVLGCTFTRNNASNGGALFASDSSIYVDGSTSFDENTALHGGAIHAIDSDIYIGGNTSFSHNSAEGSTVEIEPSTTSIEYEDQRIFTRRTPTTSSGGAIYATSSVVNIDGDTSFADNFAYFQGGAIYAEDSTIRVDGKNYFSNNLAQGASVTSYFSPSRGDGDQVIAVAKGGAIYAQTSDIGIDGNATFTNNTSVGDGGAIYAMFSEVGIGGNSSFTYNSAVVDGGAIYAMLTEVGIGGNSSFTYNSAVVDGGVVYSMGSNVFLHGNTYFSRNYAGEWGGVIAALGSSEVGIYGNATFTNNSAAIFGGAVFADESKIDIDGNAMFINNSATGEGGAIYVSKSNIIISDNRTNREDMSAKEGGYYISNRSVGFVDNVSSGVGGAVVFEKCDQVQVSHVWFKSNKASLGGAVYIVAVDDKKTSFSDCVLEDNTAADGGAVYLNTGPGVDVFTASVFRNNVAGTSGGAIFHTGSMRVFNTTFVANLAGVEGPGVMSVGVLETLSNVSFMENALICRVGEYGFIDKNQLNPTQDSFCRSCFNIVCSRCSSARGGASILENVRIDGKPVCEKPPLGATAKSSGTTVANLALTKGHFRTSNRSQVILQCYRKDACQGGEDVEKYCSEGYKGPYCAVCDNGFSPGIAYSCHNCSKDITRSAVGLAVAMGLAVILFSGLLVSHLGSTVHDGAEEIVDTNQSLWKNKCKLHQTYLVNILPVRAIKIGVTVWQIVSQFDSIAGDIYPELYQRFVSKLNAINLDLEFVFSYSCFVRNDFYDHLVLATITPLLALVLLAGSYFIGKKRNSCSEFAMREVRHKHQAVVLFIAFLVYSPVSYRIFQTFGCDELDDGDSYLRADYSISCLADRHSWYKRYAFIMVAVYPIGITAGFAGLLVWHRRDLVKPDRDTMLHLKPLNGVWAAYKPSRYYYEVVECGRRISLTVIAAFVIPDSVAQVTLALLFAVVYVFIPEVLSPFQRSVDMGLYRWGNGIIVASMYVAFLTKIDVDEDTVSAKYLLTFSGVLIAANIFMVVTVLVQTALLAKEMHANRKAVRASDRPVRRTDLMSSRDLRSAYEGGLYMEEGEGAALEFKDCEI